MLINIEVGAQNHLITQLSISLYRMSTETKDESKAIRVLPFSGQQSDRDEWSEKYQGLLLREDT